MSTSMVALKKDLRKKIRTILSDLPDAAAASQSSSTKTITSTIDKIRLLTETASNAVKTLLSLPEYKAAKRISVYLSMPSGEISTTGIVHDALKQGKQVFIPYTYKLQAPKENEPKSIMDMVELRSLKELESLEPDNWGIPTPSEESISSRANSFGGVGLTGGEARSESNLDLIVMPGMAFDSGFGRLGHGKGFYDYFLRRCEQSSRMPFRVGLSLTEQLLPSNQSVPMDSTDFRLDALILGNGELRRPAA